MARRRKDKAVSGKGPGRLEPAPDPQNYYTSMQNLRRLIEDELPRRRRAIENGSAQRDFRIWRRRIIANLTGMPPICARPCCARAGTCKAAEVPCLAHHRALVLARIALVLGYQALGPEAGKPDPGKDDDILWPR